MSYRIRYPVLHKLRNKPRTTVRLPALTVLCFLIFLLLVKFLWPEGADWLLKTIPVAGLDQVALDFLHGETVAASLSDFFTVFLS